MDKISSPHDKLWKASMGDIRVAKEFFENYLPPQLYQQLDIQSLALCPTSFVNAELKLSHSDVLYRAKIAEKLSYIYLLNEHQSKARRFMPLTLLGYDVDIWHYHLKQNPQGKDLPLILNIVFYTGQSMYNQPRHICELFNAPKELIEQVWNQPFHLVDINLIEDDAVREQKRVGMLSYFYKHTRARDFLQRLENILPLLQALEAEDGGDFVVALLNYAFDQAEFLSYEALMAMVQKELPETGERTMTPAQQVFERGIKQGEEKGIRLGMQQGMQQGEYAILMRLLERKFGYVPERYRELMQAADEDKIFEWAERLIDAEKLADIFEKQIETET